MGEKWDTTENFYDWCKLRAEHLHRVIKPGGFVLIFGHPKTNHRMKCAFEDAGFNIVEEIDWVYLTGMPKNQDIGKLFDKKAGVEREIIGEYRTPEGNKVLSTYNNWQSDSIETGSQQRKITILSTPSTEQAKIWNGWKTAGLKPAHEPITIFQKPREGTYIQNIEKYSCGGMNIDVCRVPYVENDDPRIGKEYKHHAKAGLENASQKDNSQGQLLSLHHSEGRFPPNMIMDEYIAEEFDEQTGKREGCKPHHIKSKKDGYKEWGSKARKDEFFGYADTGGGSRMFPIIKYQQKASPKERLLPNGERNPHVTLKPKELIKWLIKLVTPKDGTTIDITAGSCTHGLSCEELNRDEGYNLKWINIEMMNTEKEPYCDIAKKRILDVVVEEV